MDNGAEDVHDERVRAALRLQARRVYLKSFGAAVAFTLASLAIPL